MQIQQKNKTIIAMIHVQALPGTPAHHLPMSEIIGQAVEEAKLLEQEGVDALLIENMHDVPYLNREVGPEITACMTAVAIAVQSQAKVPCGIQILAGANHDALAVAYASSLDFVRAECFVYGHLADEGLMTSDAGKLLRYRKQLGAEHIRIYTDIRKKHASHAISSDISITEQVKTADYFRSDGIIITGSSTGIEPLEADVKQARQVTSLPVVIGSGITDSNLPAYWNLADAFIIGSQLKKQGRWYNPLCLERIHKFMCVVSELREGKKIV